MISIPGRIPVHIFPLFWFLILFIGWLNAAGLSGMIIWGVVAFISVLFHEYGHALTALAFGQEAEISLVGTGGLTTRSGAPVKKWQEFIIVLNGPLAGLLLFFLAYIIGPRIDPDRFRHLSYAFEVAIYVNLFWTILNLLPIMPLDGGQLMRILFEGMFGFNGLKISLILSIALAVVVSLIFFFTQALFAGSIFLMLAFESYRILSNIQGMSPEDTLLHLQEMMREAQEDLERGDESGALSKFLFLREQTKKGVLFVNATQSIASILAKQGHLKQAYEWLLPIEDQLSPNYKGLLHQLAYRLEEWESAIRIGNKSYQDHPSPETALLNAFSYAIMGKATPAVGWLHCAAQGGLNHLSEVIQSREFDAIRESAEFRELLRTLR
jgi:stage IV sporulation protein FB